jgi:YHS domain-containing protein
MAKDPICGMEVDAAQAAGKCEYQGNVYYFCSEHCVAKFKESPEQFVPLRKRAKPLIPSAA